MHVPPSRPISSESAESAPTRRAAATTVAPSRASRRAKCRPKPELAPVTSAVLPSTCIVRSLALAFSSSSPIPRRNRPDGRLTFVRGRNAEQGTEPAMAREEAKKRQTTEEIRRAEEREKVGRDGETAAVAVTN